MDAAARTHISSDDPNLIEAFNEARFAADALDGATPDSAEGKALAHINNTLLRLHDAGVQYPARKADHLKGGVESSRPVYRIPGGVGGGDGGVG